MRIIHGLVAIVACASLAACGGSGAGTSPTAAAAVTANETPSPAPAPAPTATVTVPPVPTATLAATPATVAPGASATLTWTSTNATACSASGGWSGSLASSGTQSTAALAAATTFSLVCSGPGGSSAAATTNVAVSAPVVAPAPPPVTPPTPLPAVALTAAPTIVAPGGTSLLTWTSTNATACTASGGWSGALPTAGSQTTAALTTNTSYSLTCTGAGGTGAAAAVAVAVSSATAAIAPRNVALTVSQTQQFTATVPGGGAVTWTVDGFTGGNAAVGTVSAAGLYTAGTTAGPHTVMATSAANTALSASAVAAVTALPGVYTYHNDSARDGSNTQEYALQPGNVNTTTFGKRAACVTDGAVVAQPLWVANVMVAGAKHNVVYAATEHDSLFAFDADASPCIKLWSVSLVDTTHGGIAGETSVPGALLGSGLGDITPEVGVTGTPVIDPATGILYVVSKSTNAAQTTFYQRIHAIDITNGAEKAGAPTLITGTYPGSGDGGATVTFNTRQELQRTGLALVNGVVYVAFTAHEDHSPWYGWMMSYAYTGGALVQKNVFNVAPHTQKGGIWMSGGAPAVDAGNNLYVLTGNGTFDATNDDAPNNDYGDSLLQLNSTLQVSQYFTPSDQLSDLQKDSDFGAGGAAVLADLPAGNTIIHALICGGKDGNLFVINRDMLGGFGDAVAVQKIAFGYAIFATGAFWNNHFYLGGLRGPLTAFTLNTANANLTRTSASKNVYGFAGATPSVSASAATNGVVWAMDTGNYCTPHSAGCGPVVLYAYDATNMQTQLWSSAQVPADAAGNAIKFTVPTVANGKVYVGTRGNNVGGGDASTSAPGELDIYGLKP